MPPWLAMWFLWAVASRAITGPMSRPNKKDDDE